MLTFGAVHTGLLQHSAALTPDQVTGLLDLVVGERVRTVTRPLPHAVSPTRLTGVDCVLPSAAPGTVRVIGTVAGRAAITGGLVLQGSAHTELDTETRAEGRKPWSYYLSHPARLEATGRIQPDDVIEGFLAARPRPDTLDVAAVGSRLMDTVQSSPQLDRQPPFRSSRTTHRWVVRTTEHGSARAVFSIESPTERSLLLEIDPEEAAAVPAFCTELALHDWLVTTLSVIIDTCLAAPGNRMQRVRRLGPAVDVLHHLWMPFARIDPELRSLWEALDDRSNLSGQWHASVNRVRDQLTLGVLTRDQRWSARKRYPTRSPGSFGSTRPS